MNLELLNENDPQLLEVSSPWDFEVDGSPEELVSEMVKTLTINGGVGLAAPQCGISKRIFVMGNFIKLVVCINPKIVGLSEQREVDIEGCLSFPNLWLKVKRPTECIVQYQDVSGQIVERELAGLEARVFLHEYDHLLGVTFDQRVGNLSMKMAKEKRKKSLAKVIKASV